MWFIIQLVIAFPFVPTDLISGGTMPKQQKRCGPNWPLKKTPGRCQL